MHLPEITRDSGKLKPITKNCLRGTNLLTAKPTLIYIKAAIRLIYIKAAIRPVAGLGGQRRRSLPQQFIRNIQEFPNEIYR